MALKVNVETIDTLRRRLAVEVPAEQVHSELEKAFGELAREARVAGFRPGRVPRQVLDRKFGDRVRGEVFARLIQESYSEAVADSGLEALGVPEIVTEQSGTFGPLRYSATVEVRPHIVVERYRGLEVKRVVPAVTDVEVEARIERLRQSLAQLHPVADRSVVQAGDVVTMDYEARLENRVVGKGENRDVEMGANGFPPEFDQSLVGASVGSDLEFSGSYPDGQGPAEFAGKTLAFRVRPKRLMRKELPSLDDEFAKDHGECETLEELRGRIHKQLEAVVARAADDAMRQQLLSRLAEVNDAPVPEALVRQRLDALVEEVRHEWRSRRIVPKDERSAIERVREELGPRAREQAKVGLLLDAIAEQERIVVSEEDVTSRVNAIATEAGAAADRIRAAYESPEARRQLRRRMLQSRVIDLVVDAARVAEVDA